MAKQSKPAYPPEFTNWLKGQKGGRKVLRRNGASLETYYQEWQKTVAKQKKRSIFALPKMDLNKITSNMRTMSELLETMQGLKSMVKTQPPDKPGPS